MRETKALLVETGLREFALHGLDIPSIRGICASAGLTRGAFYTHFRDRDEFFVAVMERALEEMAGELPKRGILRDDIDELFTVAGRILAELSRRAASRQATRREGELRFHLLLAASDRSTPVRTRFRASLDGIRERLATLLRDAQRSGRVRDDLGADELASHVITHALGSLAWTSAGIPVDAEQSLHVMRRFLEPPATSLSPASKPES